MGLIYIGDFEKLKKFDMVYNPSSEIWTDDKDYQILTIYENDRTIELETMQTSFGNYKITEKLNDNALYILYDLIKSGLVKKEKENEQKRYINNN